MKWTLLLVLLLFAVRGFTQHFNWASTGMGVGTGVCASAYSIRGELLVAMDYSKPSYLPFDSRIVMYSNVDDSLDLGYHMNEFIFVAYDKRGKFLYHKSGSLFGEHFFLYGIAARSDGNFVIAYKAFKVPGNVGISNLDGTPYDRVFIPSWVNHDSIDENINFDGTHTYTGDATLFSVLSPTGDVLNTSAICGFDRYLWKGFSGTLDGGLMIALSEHRLEKTEFGYTSWVQYDCLRKFNKNFHLQWQHDTKEISESSCGSFIPGMRAVSTEDGRLYAVGTMYDKIFVQGSHVHEVQKKCGAPSDNQQAAYEAYINCISESGKLLWVKYSEAPVIFDDVSGSRQHVFVSGRLICSDRVFGEIVDTSFSKRTFIACLDLKGNLQWAHTFCAQQICRLDADGLGRLNAYFNTMDASGVMPLVVGRDTLKGFYSQLIVASFQEDGKALWTKTSRVPMAGNGVEETQLYHDDCGNVFVVGSMWFMGSVGFACFDAAFVKGTGYAGAPLVAMIQTTIPPENLVLFKDESFSRGLDYAVEQSLEMEISETGHNIELLDQCIPIANPWSIQVLPNPTDGKYTAKVSVSYAARNVEVELFTSMGVFIKTLFHADVLEAQDFMIEDDISTLAAGAFLLILRGDGGAASTRVVKVN